MTFLSRSVLVQLHAHRSYLSFSLWSRTMSVQAALAKLPSPLKDLVSAAAHVGSEDFGKSEKDKAEVAQWIDKVAQGDVAKPENFKVRTLPSPEVARLDMKQALDASLVPRTYLVSNYFTAADVALYGALHPSLVRLPCLNVFSASSDTHTISRNCSQRSTTLPPQSPVTSTMSRTAPPSAKLLKH